MPFYALGPWQFDGVDTYLPPAGSVGHVDLSPVQATPTLLFVASPTRLSTSTYDTLGSGDLRDLAQTRGMRDIFEARLGYRPSGATLLDLLWDCLTAGADAAGLLRCKPLIPTSRGFLELHLGGHSVVRREAFHYGQHAHTAQVRAVLRADFRRVFAQVESGAVALEAAQRTLGSHRQKYRVDDWREFVDEDIRPDIPGDRKPETIITESFATADADTLGPDLAWTELEGDWDIVSGAAQIAGSSGQQTARANHDLSSADHYVQAALLNHIDATNARRSVMCRKDSTATATFYVFDVRRSSATANDWRTLRRVAGTFTAIGTNTNAVTFVPGSILRGESDGSTIRRYRNGVLQNEVTDTNITGNLRTGITGDGVGIGHRLGSFEAGDLVHTVTRTLATSVAYRVRTTPDTTASGTYRIRLGGQDAVAPSVYRVARPMDSTRQAQYAVPSVAAATHSGAYQIRALVNRVAASTYRVGVPMSLAVSAQYRVGGQPIPLFVFFTEETILQPGFFEQHVRGQQY